MVMSNEYDDEIALPIDTLAALQSFYAERDARSKQFEDLKTKAEAEFDGQEVSIEDFAEDWNASQFWYSDETASTLAEALLDGVTKDTWIAVVSAPSVFVQMKKMLPGVNEAHRPHIVLFEYDERFSVFKEFTSYDYMKPLRLPVELKGRFDRIIVDPPFLSDDCQTKVALTVHWLSKPQQQDDAHRVDLISCTGAVMEPLILKLYAKHGVRRTTFRPQHSKGLSNEFRCFANFAGERLR